MQGFLISRCTSYMYYVLERYQAHVLYLYQVYEHFVETTSLSLSPHY